MTRTLTFTLLLACCIAQSACVCITVGTDSNARCLKSDGLVNGYAGLATVRPYDGKILDFGICSGSRRWGNLVSLDLWPIAGIGVGFVGAQAKIFPFETGFGVFGYDPQPEFARITKPTEEAKEKENCKKTDKKPCTQCPMGTKGKSDKEPACH